MMYCEAQIVFYIALWFIMCINRIFSSDVQKPTVVHLMICSLCCATDVPSKHVQIIIKACNDCLFICVPPPCRYIYG